jgi:trehalose 6-phosphate synthase
MRQIVSVFALIAFIVGLIVISFTFQQVGQEKNNLTLDLQHRSNLLTDNIKDGVESALISNTKQSIPQIVKNFMNNHRIEGLAVFDNKDALIATSSGFPNAHEDAKTIAATTMDADKSNSMFDAIQQQKLYLFAIPLHDNNQSVIGSIVLVQNATYIDTAVQNIWKRNGILFIINTLIIYLAIITILLWIIYQPINNFVQSIKKARLGKLDQLPLRFAGNFFLQPIITEVTKINKSLSEARKIASQEARLRLEKIDSPWTAQRLKEFTKDILKGRHIVVVSNREPYIHTKQNGKINLFQPASGMVTAIEPIMFACGGTWLAHGSGNADKETVNKNDIIAVPPEDPQYNLHRVWLTAEEEKGYYNGFSNEGLWPLCHMVHIRPIFRKEDWEEYKKVNGKFAETLLKEIKDIPKPIILIQDYHFAMLPRMIKQARPDATIGIFWHIPWPHSEAFRICPWRKELLDGMLGADLLGFHTQLHCNNFIDTVGKELESLINLEEFAVQRKDHISYIKPFPISIPFSEESLKKTPKQETSLAERQNILQKLRIKSKYIGLGVDRLDYTKGILERLQAVEYFLEKHPKFKEQFTFIQIGAPSRSAIPHYARFEKKVEQEVTRINEKLQINDWKPIVLLKKHHTHEEINQLYKIADVCLVTSLHDGMNLVAKEYIIARTDEKGVLILSQFTGASQKLKEALIINPYNIEQTSESLYTGLTMLQSEQTKRMKRLREIVINFNVYRWSAELLKTLVTLE